MDSIPKEIELKVPQKVKDKYNDSLSELKAGKGTMIGNEDKLEMLEDALLKPETPSGMILGEQGIGKTALVEQFLFLHKNDDIPYIIVSLSIEKLGELASNVVVSRMRSLQSDMQMVEEATRDSNENKPFHLVLFIDEIHKLYRYGYANGSSGAMNALKEGLARGEFPILTATTDYEYRKNIVSDPAFDRRFSKIIMEEPSLETVGLILKKRLFSWNKNGKYIPDMSLEILKELISFSDIYIRNQVNPAKSIAMLEMAVAHETSNHLRNKEATRITHNTLKFVFASEGYNIDSPATAKHVRDVVQRRIRGQPLAIKAITDVINSTYYTKRDRRKPLFTSFFVGTTGTGKTETAKALSEAFFGRSDALLVLNGGDYSIPEDAIKAQHFIGDNMAVNKQKVILLDEIEKSHPDVLFSYMRMIDEGVVRDSLNIERSINNTVVIATSNLGAKTFDDIQTALKLDNRKDPDVLTEELVQKWYEKDSSVRKSLTTGGDAGANNAIKPEFLERFQLFVPYLPLANATKAQIARSKLEKLKKEEKELGYYVQLPNKWSNDQWNTNMKVEAGTKSCYADIDKVSVMIAEDVINVQSSQTGARAINRFMENSVKPQLANCIAERVEEDLPTDGAFRIDTNSFASFETLEKRMPGVTVTYVPREEL